MASLFDSSVSRPRAGLWSRLSTARRRAAVVTSAALLAAGAGVASSLAVSDASAVSATVAPADEPPPPVVTTVPPVALVSHVEVPTPDPPASAGTDGEAETDEETAEGQPVEGGKASYYGAELAGNPTASGEAFDPTDLTAAHRTMPFGTRLRVTNERTGASVVVRVNDRGPFHGDRVIDVSTAAAKEIGLKRAGTARVSLERLPKKPARG